MPDLAVQGVHPEIWALSRLLGSAGHDDRLSSALGLAGGAGFLGMGFRYDRDGFSSLHVSGWNPFQSAIVGAVERLGLVRVLDETGSRRSAAKWLDRALEDDGIAAVWVDGATLGIAPPELAGMSPSVVIARRTAGGGVEIESAGARPREVEPSRLAEARARSRTHRHRLLGVAPGTPDRPAAVRFGLAAVAVGAVRGPKTGSGPDGIAHLAAQIDGRGRGSWRETFAGDRHLLGALIGLRAQVVAEGGLLRGLQAEFDRAAADVLEIAALHDTAAAHAALADAWLALADRALPADVPGFAEARKAASPFELPDAVREAPFPLDTAEQDALLAELAREVRAIAAAEREALEQLRTTLRTH